LIEGHPALPLGGAPWLRCNNTYLAELSEQGDDKLIRQSPTLTNCDRARAFSLCDRCTARYAIDGLHLLIRCLGLPSL
jgi:hypothetical protein